MSQAPGSSREAIQQAAQLLQRGALVEARNLLAGVLAREPGNSDALSILGVALAQGQDFGGAVDAMQRAVNMNPQHAAAQLNLGHALKRLGRLAEAAEALRKAVTLRPDSLPAHRLLASTLLDLSNGMRRRPTPFRTLFAFRRTTLWRSTTAGLPISRSAMRSGRLTTSTRRCV